MILWSITGTLALLLAAGALGIAMNERPNAGKRNAYIASAVFLTVSMACFYFASGGGM